jgi:hypothetical protein
VATPTLVRYFDLAGGVDEDPIQNQPARDAFGPLLTGFGQRVSVDAWVVDATGAKVAPAGLTFSLAIVWVWRVPTDADPAAAVPVENDMWARGSVVSNVIPGEELTQVELGDVVGFTAIVTQKSASPAGMRLAIYAVLGPRA